MAVSMTSRIAYHNLDPEKLKLVKEKIICTVAMAVKPSNADLERLTGVRLSSVCGRVNELCQDGLVEAGGFKIDPFTKHTVTWWKLTEQGEQTFSKLVEKATQTNSVNYQRGYRNEQI